MATSVFVTLLFVGAFIFISLDWFFNFSKFGKEVREHLNKTKARLEEKRKAFKEVAKQGARLDKK